MVEKKVDNCKLCQSVNERIRSFDLVAPKLPDEKRIYKVTESFISGAEKHPIIEGPYFLLYPKEHYTSFRQINTLLDTEIREHVDYLCEISKAPNLITFEHGQATEGNKVKSIYHAHYHVIPTDMSENDVLGRVQTSLNHIGLNYTVSKKNAQDGYVSRLREHLNDAPEYLYFSFNETSLYIVDDGTKEIPSQYFRVLLSEIASPGVPFRNWKDGKPEDFRIFEDRLMRFLP